MKIGITYDLREEYLKLGYSEEETAEFDRPSTIEAIDTALSTLGHETVRIGNIFELTRRLAAGERWDLVFNIAEGLHGVGREAQVPALLDAFQIPYTFSDPFVLALSLHKAMTKDEVRRAGVPTAAHALVESDRDLACLVERVDGRRTLDLRGPIELGIAASGSLQLPLFVKPNAEGTGKGIDARSVVRTPEELQEVCLDLLARFSQPVLVETYLPGREFTVGIAGTGDKAVVLGVAEVAVRAEAVDPTYSYVNKEKCEELVIYLRVDDPEARTAASHGLAAWKRLGCRDAGRVDLKSDAHGAPHFLEVNPLAGLNPEHSDLPIICTREGIPYLDLIRRIVESAAERTVACPSRPQQAPSASVGSPEPAREGAPPHKQKAVILHAELPPDAPEDEQDTAHEVEALCEGLAGLGYDPRPVAFTTNMKDVSRQILALSPGFVFNVVESADGTDRLIHLAPTLLEHMGIPYTGSGPQAVFTSTSKILAKRLMVAASIPTPRWWDASSAIGGLPPFSPPYIIKSVYEHASIGLDEANVVQSIEKLQERFPHVAAGRIGELFVEEYIDGREFNLAVVAGVDGPVVLAPAEMRFDGYPPDKPKVVGYRAKWKPESFEFSHTVRSFDFSAEDAQLLAHMKSIALDCWSAFGFAGYVRVDFRVDSGNRPFVLEININPCLSPDSGFRATLERAGLPFLEFLALTVNDALKRRGTVGKGAL